MGQGMTKALAGKLLLAETMGTKPPAPEQIPGLQNKHRQEPAHVL